MNDSIGSINAKLPSPKCVLTAKSRANFDNIHLHSAQLFAEHALTIEQDSLSVEKPQQVSTEITQSYKSYVASSIMSSVAAIEAKINQFMVDNYEKLDASPHVADDTIYKKFQRLNKNEKIVNQLFVIPTVKLKYEVVSFLLTGGFLPHNQLVEETDYLIRLRNALVHFRPEWDNSLNLHRKLESSKKNFFNCSPFYNEKSLFIPYRCLSASCASWAHKTALAFIEYFFHHQGSH